LPARSLESILKRDDEKNPDILLTVHLLADPEMEERRQTAITIRSRQTRLTEKTTIARFDLNHYKSQAE